MGGLLFPSFPGCSLSPAHHGAGRVSTNGPQREPFRRVSFKRVSRWYALSSLFPRLLTLSSGNAVPPAGADDQDAIPFADPADGALVTTTPAGVAVTASATAAPNESEQLPQTDPAPPAAPPKPPLYKRRWFIVANIIGACLGIALTFILLFPVVRAIIQDVVNKTTLDITMAAITNPTNSSYVSSSLLYPHLFPRITVFSCPCKARYVSSVRPWSSHTDNEAFRQVDHTGIFSAVISFPTPVNVSWIDNSTKVPLGYMQLSTLYARNKHATINVTTTFHITNQNAFGRFTSAMITSQNFTWQLENYDLTVQAEKFPVAHGISFNKMLTINGELHFRFSL